MSKKNKTTVVSWNDLTKTILEYYKRTVVEMPDTGSPYLIIHLYHGAFFVPKELKERTRKKGVYMTFRVHHIAPEKSFERKTNPKKPYPGYAYAASRKES